MSSLSQPLILSYKFRLSLHISVSGTRVNFKFSTLLLLVVEPFFLSLRNSAADYPIL